MVLRSTLRVGTLHCMWKYAAQPIAAEAQQNAADNPAEALSHLTERLGELKASLATLRPEYEYSPPFLFGGAGATTPALFTMPEPFHTPCEYHVLAITFLDVGTAALSSVGDPSALLAGTPNVTPGGLFGQQVFAAAAAVTIVPADCWLPLEANAQLQFAVSSSSKVAYATLVFRRRINPVGVPSFGY